MTQSQLIKRLREIIAEKGSQKATAEFLGVSAVYLSDVLAGRRDAGPKLLNKLGLESRRIYISKEQVA